MCVYPSARSTRVARRDRESIPTLHRSALAPPDALLFAVVAALIGVGLVMIFSASSATAYADFHDTAYYLKRQSIWLVVGLGAAFAAYRCDYRKIKSLAPYGVVITLFFLILTLIPHIGLAAGGARRWLGAGPISFQPSEMAKLALVVYLATALSNWGERVRSLTRGVWPILCVTLALALLILVEPDMGTASLLIFTAFVMLFVAGARVEHLALVIFVMLPAVAITVGSSSYKRARILAFLDPWKDAQNTGFHIVQSLLALGSGGAIGLGLGASRQKFFYLPEQYTDFIFAIIGEELGLFGAICVVALFVIFAYRAIRIALGAPDRFGFFLAIGCTCIIIIQAFINIGVVTSSWPVTGVPLPFVSFGGTSLVVSMIASALIINVGRHRAPR